MSETEARLKAFVKYAHSLQGDEKGEAQVFCDRLFQAFGHKGYKEAGATLEFRIKEEHHRTKYADLIWKPRLLIEMKSVGGNLHRYYQQAFSYWLRSTPNRPRYVVLCNFEEFWIYDFDLQLDEPVDRVKLAELPERYVALNFLFPDERKPQFGNDRIAVTRAAADKVASVFNTLVARGLDREQGQRFILQAVVAMFSEDCGLLPRGLFTSLIDDSEKGSSTYDLFGGLFRQMNSKSRATGGRFKDVRYFNGGLFSEIDPIELEMEEVHLLKEASSENWSKVQPAVFGTLFQSSMDKTKRHALGAHFTNEAEIQKVVHPTIVHPWRQRIKNAHTLKDFQELREDLIKYRVLDPACGSGNFLYIAYRELVRLEMELVLTGLEKLGKAAARKLSAVTRVNPQHFFGIDIDSFAVELAKVTLMLGKQLAGDEARKMAGALELDIYQTLPLDNLDKNIVRADALLSAWPEADAIIGNPPYQSKNKMQKEFGRAYLNKVAERYPQVPGHADYCVYWFRRAHDELKKGGRAGLVGTNTIRQNYSREGGLDYVVKNKGTITEAVSTQVWPGDAVVHVSIVNWIKGKEDGKKCLFFQRGEHRDSPFELVKLDSINSSLSAGIDLTDALELTANSQSPTCFQGQTHGHEGFLLAPKDAAAFISQSSKNQQVLFPFLTGDELLSSTPPKPQRFVIDFFPKDINEASTYKQPFERLQEIVLKDRKEAAREEEERNKLALADSPNARVNHHHKNFLARWWHMSYPRGELLEVLSKIPRYIACARVTKRPIFEFVRSSVRPNDALQVFALADDYSFGILASEVHWAWFTARCSTLKGDFRYTSNTVFDTFAWPQDPTPQKVRAVAGASSELRKKRRSIMAATGKSLRDIYRALELPGENPLRDVQKDLDDTVRAVYGMPAHGDCLGVLLELNQHVASETKAGKIVRGPGLPTNIPNHSSFMTDDGVKA